MKWSGIGLKRVGGIEMIRNFREEDIDQVMSIWLLSNLDAHAFVSENYWISNKEMVRELLLQAELYVFEKNNQIIAFAGLQNDYLAGIFVAKKERSQGTGKQLLDFLKTKHQHLSLSVYVENKNAVTFYQKNGFTIESKDVEEATKQLEYQMIWSSYQV